MKKLYLSIVLSIAGILLLPAQEQPKTPEIMSTGTLEEQLDYVQQKTNIYNNYRAVREDIFLSIKRNALDSLNSVKNKTIELENRITSLNNDKDSLNSLLETTQKNLDHAVKNRNSLLFLGIPMHKVLYNSIMWSLLAGLITFMVILLLLYLRNRTLTVRSKKELDGVKEEFETYRKTNREKMEKLIVEHFNEIKKLKGEK